MFTSLLNGAALAIPTDEDKENVRSLMDFIERHKVTMLSGFPYLLAEMNHLPEIPKSLRLLISGGDVLRGAYVDRLVGQAEVYNTYGPSETTVCASYYRCNDGTVLEDGTYPIGRPVKTRQSAYWIRTGMNCLTEKQVKFAYMETAYLSDISACRAGGSKKYN